MARQAIIVISSHVVRGSVGNRAAVFALETLGHPVWAVPTIVMPWHPGHGRSTRSIADDDVFAAMLRDLEGAQWLGEVGAVLSGYLGSPAQASAIASLVRAVKQVNPGALYVCDPVSGDNGGLYVSEAIVEAMRKTLLPLADVATPNRFELGQLTGTPCESAAAILAAASALGPETVLVTSTPAAAGRIGNLLVRGGSAMLASHDVVELPPNGLGDLTAALLLAHRMRGAADDEALSQTTASVFEILGAAVRRNSDELQLETDARSLRTPAAAITIENIRSGTVARKAPLG